MGASQEGRGVLQPQGDQGGRHADLAFVAEREKAVYYGTGRGASWEMKSVK